jgi:hypothetical protein
MGGFSLWHWIIILIVGLIFLIPIAKILNKAGYSGWLALLWCVPILNIICLWVFAFSDWPSSRGAAAR